MTSSKSNLPDHESGEEEPSDYSEETVRDS